MAKRPLKVYKAGEVPPPSPAQNMRNTPAPFQRKGIPVYAGAVDRDRMNITQQVVDMPELPASISSSSSSSDLGRTKYDELLNAIYDTVLITSETGAILESNKRARHNFLLTTGDLVQMNIIDLVAGADDHLLDVITNNVSDKRYTIIEAICVRGDNSRFNAEIVVNRFKAIPGSALCFFMRDISARKKAEEELKQAAAQLMDAERVETRLETLSTIFYEINNPLQILTCMAEMDKNREYKKQLDRVMAVLESLRKNEHLEEIEEEDGSRRFNIPRVVDLEPANKTILIVAEDEKVIREIFINALAPAFPDMTIKPAANGREAADLFMQTHAAVIVMDSAMPVLSGEDSFEIIEDYCAANGWEQPSVIFCTGFYMGEKLQGICKENPNCVSMKKPLSISELVETVGKLTGKVQPEAAAVEPAKDAPK